MGDLTSAALLLRALRNHGDRPAITADGTTLTYAHLDAASDRVAGALAALGIGRGDAVALHLRNGPEYVLGELAIQKLAAIRVPLNELMAAPELSYCLEHSRAKALIAHASLPEPHAAAASLVRVSVADEAPARPGQIAWTDLLSGRPLDEPTLPDAADTAILAYTGGTTGRPKGVRHSYGRMAINLLAHVVCGDVRSDEVMLLTTPLPHSAGYHLAACLLQGGRGVLERRFDPAGVLVTMAREGVTWTFAVPTMLYRLLDNLTPGAPDISRLRTIVYGAAPMSRPRLEEALQRLGSVFVQIYGQTECPNFITTLSKQDHARAELLTSCGRPVPFVQLRIAPTDEAEGDVGEVEVRSPYLLEEYFRDADATAAAMQGGWLKTGDIGFLKDGYLFLVDRAKDMIISGGMNVYSTEVEAALRAHPAVTEAAVVGVPDADWGEAVTAMVVTRDPVSEPELRAFARSRLSAYKTPKRIIFLVGLPLTAYGKIDKKALRQRLVEGGTP